MRQRDKTARLAGYSLERRSCVQCPSTFRPLAASQLYCGADCAAEALRQREVSARLHGKEAIRALIAFLLGERARRFQVQLTFHGGDRL